MQHSSEPATALESTSTIIQRRKLADNVICLFLEDRPVVFNAKRRGRFPKNVIRFTRKPYLSIGDTCVVCTGKNYGKKVRILSIHVNDPDLGPGTYYYAQATGAWLSTVDFETGEQNKDLQESCFFLGKEIRRDRGEWHGQIR